MERSALIDCRNDTDDDTMQICNFGPIYTFSEAHVYSLARSSIGSYASLSMRAFSHRIQCTYWGRRGEDSQLSGSLMKHTLAGSPPTEHNGDLSRYTGEGGATEWRIAKWWEI